MDTRNIEGNVTSTNTESAHGTSLRSRSMGYHDYNHGRASVLPKYIRNEERIESPQFESCAQYDLYLPTRDSAGLVLVADESGILESIAQKFGGFTQFSYELGGYQSPGNNTQYEGVHVIRVLAPDTVESDLFFTTLGAMIRETYSQESVLIAKSQASMVFVTK
jgi:hypothetical protein